MRKSIGFVAGVLCAVTLSLWCASSAQAEGRIRISDVSMSANPFDPRAGQTMTISGKILEQTEAPEIPVPQVSAVIAEKIIVPVTLTPGEVSVVNAEPVEIMAEWQFTLTWDGTVPWDLFPQGTYSCMITAVSSVDPKISVSLPVRIFIQPAAGQPQ